MTVFTNLVLIFGIQGLLLAFAISRLKKGDINSNRFLVGFILLISVTLLGRYFYNNTFNELWRLKIVFIGDLVLFLYGPMFYFYLNRLFFAKNQSFRTTSLHLIPVVLFVISVLPLMFEDYRGFARTYRRFEYVYLITEAAAIAINFVYLLMCFRLIRRYKRLSAENLSYITGTGFYKNIILIGMSVLTAWLVSFVLTQVYPNSYDSLLVYHIVWVILSGSILVVGYYAMNQPQLFYIKREENGKGNKNYEDCNKYAIKVTEIMSDEKPFLDPALTLAKLSELCEIHPHLLSRTLNECIKQNFFEFVNSYRVDEFISLSKEKENEKYTFLELAYKSGFNSKSTFNSAFKKVTGKTPKEMMKSKNAA